MDRPDPGGYHSGQGQYPQYPQPRKLTPRVHKGDPGDSGEGWGSLGRCSLVSLNPKNPETLKKCLLACSLTWKASVWSPGGRAGSGSPAPPETSPGTCRCSGRRSSAVRSSHPAARHVSQRKGEQCQTGLADGGMSHGNLHNEHTPADCPSGPNPRGEEALAAAASPSGPLAQPRARLPARALEA